MGIGARTSDVLVCLDAIEDVHVMVPCPVGTHAYAQVSAAVRDEFLDQRTILSHEHIIAIGVANASWYSHYVHITEEAALHLVLAEYLEPVVLIQRLHHAVSTGGAALRIVNE